MSVTTDSPAPADRPVPADPIRVQWLGHATTLIEVGGLRILTDPFLGRRLGPLERHGAVPDPTTIGRVDVVLVSHGHHDHFDRASLAALPGRPTVIVPGGLGSAARAAVPGRVLEIDVDTPVELEGIAIRAVPARHWISPGAPRALPIGFVVDDGGRRVYFAGDTGPFPGLAATVGRVDLALLPVWTWGPHLGPGHLGPRAAAEVLASLGGPAAVPIHWGTLYPRALHRAFRRPLDEPGPRFAGHAARIVPGAPVRVLHPGETADIIPRAGGADRALPS
jgi:L-ascorbate metabolism protein UlaG (beta-lactamase superfamily)